MNSSATHCYRPHLEVSRHLLPIWQLEKYVIAYRGKRCLMPCPIRRDLEAATIIMARAVGYIIYLPTNYAGGNDVADAVHRVIHCYALQEAAIGVVPVPAGKLPGAQAYIRDGYLCLKRAVHNYVPDGDEGVHSAVRPGIFAACLAVDRLCHNFNISVHC